jgi:hypothetical protein
MLQEPPSGEVGTAREAGTPSAVDAPRIVIFRKRPRNGPGVDYGHSRSPTSLLHPGITDRSLEHWHTCDMIPNAEHWRVAVWEAQECATCPLGEQWVRRLAENNREPAHPPHKSRLTNVNMAELAKQADRRSLAAPEVRGSQRSVTARTGSISRLSSGNRASRNIVVPPPAG